MLAGSFLNQTFNATKRKLCKRASDAAISCHNFLVFFLLTTPTIRVVLQSRPRAVLCHTDPHAGALMQRCRSGAEGHD